VANVVRRRNVGGEPYRDRHAPAYAVAVARDLGGDLPAAGVAMSPAALVLAGEHPLAGQVRDFLADQECSPGRPSAPSARTADLVQLAVHTDRDVTGVDAVLRSWSASIADLSSRPEPASRPLVTRPSPRRRMVLSVLPDSSRKW
jgi:hypothetical protein